jgi:dihydroxy-acid dehydratase
VIREGDIISLNIEKRTIDVELTASELDHRLRSWKAPAPKYTSGVFQKYVKLVGSAAQGAVTA